MGTYADSLLASGEVVIRRQRQHWLALILDGRLAVGLWGIAILLLLAHLLFKLKDTAASLTDWPAIILLVIGIVVFAYRWWQWRSEEYIVTNRRLLKVSGLVNKREADSNLEKINDAILEENLLGRMLGYGDLDILTAAEVAVDRYRMLRHARAFKLDMLNAKHQLEDGAYLQQPAPPVRSDPASPPVAAPALPPQAPPPARTDSARADTPDEVTAALEQLAKLRDAGTISKADYDAKKQELLGRL